MTDTRYAFGVKQLGDQWMLVRAFKDSLGCGWEAVGSFADRDAAQAEATAENSHLGLTDAEVAEIPASMEERS